MPQAARACWTLAHTVLRVAWVTLPFLLSLLPGLSPGNAGRQPDLQTPLRADQEEVLLVTSRSPDTQASSEKGQCRELDMADGGKRGRKAGGPTEPLFAPTLGHLDTHMCCSGTSGAAGHVHGTQSGRPFPCSSGHAHGEETSPRLPHSLNSLHVWACHPSPLIWVSTTCKLQAFPGDTDRGQPRQAERDLRGRRLGVPQYQRGSGDR